MQNQSDAFSKDPENHRERDRNVPADCKTKSRRLRWSDAGRVLINPRLQRGSVNVRFAPKATEVLRCRELTRCARSCRERLQQNGSGYSITSSARASNVGGTSMPSA